MLRRILTSWALVLGLAVAPLLQSSTPPYFPHGTAFDGSVDYFLRGADLTGNADGKTGILSTLLRLDGGDGIFITLLANAGGNFQLFRTSGNIIRVLGFNATPTEILRLSTISTYTTSPAWFHLLLSWDLAISAEHLYIDDVSDLVVGTSTDDTIEYTKPDWSVGAATSGANKFNGALAELYFAPNQYLDFSVESNRRKFIDAGGYPVDLGPGCYKPTGTKPLVCMVTQFNNFGLNSGTGGDFADQGLVAWTAGPVPFPFSEGRVHVGRASRGRVR